MEQAVRQRRGIYVLAYGVQDIKEVIERGYQA